MVTFYLKNPESPMSYIWVQGKTSNGRFRKSTGFQINTKYFVDGWISMKGADKSTRNNLETIESNLKHLRSKFDKLQLDYKVSNRLITAVEIDAILSGKSVSQDGSFATLYARIINMASRGEITKPDGTRYSDLTIRAWVMNKSVILKYIGNIQVSEIGLSHLRTFVTQMNHLAKAKNYIAVHIKNFKNALGIMHRIGLSQNTIYQSPEFRPKYEQVDKMYLTDTEVALLGNLDLSHSKYLDTIRDFWMVMYYTGLRISDAKSLNKSHIRGQYIEIMNKKTGKVVVIPIHPVLKQIISKYNGFPQAYAEAPINREMKHIGKICGLTDKFTYKETRGGIHESYTCEKWELLSCHTARRSTTTNLIKSGVTHEIAGDMLGMSARTFGIYNRLSARDKAGVLKDNPFFMG